MKTDRVNSTDNLDSAGTLPEPAATLAEQRRADRAAAGWTAKDFKPPRKPMAGIRRIGGSWLYSTIGGIWDHAYRLVHRDGRVLWVGEPYQIDSEGLQMIAELREQGYEVEIRPDWAIHYPGCTLAVLVSERKPG